jgi:5-formyltetrahydrofolate cyclo-ligase
VVFLKSKKEMRKKVLELRKELLEKDVLEKSKIITNKIIVLKEFLESKNIMVYMDFSNEVSTKFIIEKCFEMGKKVFLPKVVRQSKRGYLEVYQITDIKNQLSKGTYGILEPKEEAAKKVHGKTIDMVVVPGVAFDEKRNRIGYGAGYYDAFLKDTKEGCHKVGIAFEVQICSHIPTEEHDVPLDMIVTEERIIR